MAPSPSPSHSHSHSHSRDNSSTNSNTMMTSDELDWLVHSYLQESGYHHTAFSLLNESSLAGPTSSSSASSAAASPAPSTAGDPHGHQPNGRRASSVGAASSSGASRNPVMETVVPPGHLVRILQKGLLYLEAEARYRGESPAAPKPRLIGYTIPNALPLPPLPKHVPPPAPPAPAPKPAPPPPAATAKPAAAPPPPAAKPTSQEKGKGKAAPTSIPTAGAGGAKRKGPSNVSDREDGPAAEGAKRPRTASTEEKKSANGEVTGAGGGKKKVKPVPAAGAGEKEKENKDVKGRDKGKGKAVEQEQEQDEQQGVDGDGDVGMEDGEAGRGKGEKEKEKEKERQGGKSRDGEGASGAAGGGGKKREREKERKDGELRPPPAKKSAAASTTSSSASTSAPAPSVPTSSTPVSASSSTQPKRSISPSTSRKSVPTKPSSSTTSASDSALPNSTSTSSALPSTSSSASVPLGQGTGKIRITTSTKTISTPLPPSASSTSASNTSAGASRLPQSTSAKDADKLLKVKSEGDPSASSSNGPKTNGSSSRPVPPPPPPPPGGGGGKKSSKPPSSSSTDPIRKPSSSSTSSSSTTTKDSKEKDKSKEKKRDRDNTGGGVDMKHVKRVGSEDVRGVVKLRGHTVAKVQPCAFNTHVPSLLATGGGDSTCRIWDVPPPSTSSTSSTSSSQTVVSDHIVCKHASAQRKVDITCVAWDPSGSLLATGSEDGIARIWTPSGDLHLVLSMHMRSICSLKWSPSGTQLLTSSLDQTVCLWELSSGKVRQQYATHADSILDVDWLDEGTWASASMDKTVHLLSTSRPTPLHRFRGHRDEVNAIHFSPCGTLLASCSDDSTIRIHSLRSIPSIAAAVAARPVKKGDRDRLIDQDEEDGGGGGVWVLEGHKGEVHQVAWHPRAGKEGEEGPRLIASCSFDHTARLWNADTGSLLYTFSRSTDFVYSVAFEPQLGRWLATGNNDGRLEVWKVADRSLHLEYTHSAPIYELTWHPHGTQIAVCGESEDVAVVAFEGGSGKGK